MWVARDKDGWGGLHLWKVKPTRGNYCWKTKYSGDDSFQLDDALFPDLKWEDEPIEVDLFNKETQVVMSKKIYHKTISAKIKCK